MYQQSLRRLLRLPSLPLQQYALLFLFTGHDSRSIGGLQPQKHNDANSSPEHKSTTNKPALVAVCTALVNHVSGYIKTRVADSYYC